MAKGLESFELRTAQDLLDKAKRDYEACKANPSADLVFNLVCTLNHVSDWADKDEETRIPAAEVGHVSSSDEARIVRQLCNRFKHFEKKSGHPEVSHRPGGAFSSAFSDGFDNAPEAYVVDDRGEQLDILSICSSLIQLWRGAGLR